MIKRNNNALSGNFVWGPWTADTPYPCAQTSPPGPCLVLGAVVFDPDRVPSREHQGRPSSPELAHKEMLLGKPSVEALWLLVQEELPYTWRETDSWGSQLENSTKGHKQLEGRCQDLCCPSLGMDPSQENKLLVLANNPLSGIFGFIAQPALSGSSYSWQKKNCLQSMEHFN